MIKNEVPTIGSWVAYSEFVAFKTISDDVVFFKNFICDFAGRTELGRFLRKRAGTDEAVDHMLRDVVRNL